MKPTTAVGLLVGGCILTGIGASYYFSPKIIRDIDRSIGETGGWENSKKRILVRTELGRTGVRIGVFAGGAAAAGLVLYGLSYSVKGSQKFVGAFGTPPLMK